MKSIFQNYSLKRLAAVNGLFAVLELSPIMLPAPSSARVLEKVAAGDGGLSD
jgi:hypothetical protein